MLDEKSLEESKRVVTELVKDNRIIRPSAQQEGFFLQKAIDSLRVSKRLFEISEDKNESIDGYMWVVNTAYYSMFFAATSLLANLGKKIDLEVGIHRMTYHALVYFFLVEDSKLQKHFVEQYHDVYDDAEQLLQISQEKARNMVENLGFEQSKRKIFTYDVGMITERNKALTSLKRAEEFLIETRKMLQ